MDFYLLSIAIGAFIGFVMALTGAGGSILAVPLLVFFLNISIAEAAPIALVAVMISSMTATIQNLFMHTVRYKTAILIAVFGIIFALIGVVMAKRISDSWLSYIFIFVLWYVAWKMWHQSTEIIESNENKPAPACALNAATSRLFWTASCTKRLMLTGSLAGLLSGLLGVGGGFIIVPSLKQVTNFSMQTIIATTLMAVGLVSMASITMYSAQSNVVWAIALPFTLSTVITMLAFKKGASLFSEKTTQRSFAVLALVAGLSLLMNTGIIF